MKRQRFISILRKYRLIRLVGGVLLGCLFALVPNSVSAYTDLSIPSVNIDLRLYSNHRIYGGCMFKTYDVNSNFSPYLGDLIDGFHNCGYAKSSNGGLSNWSDRQQVGYVNATYSNGSWTYGNPTISGGTNLLNSWGSDNANSLGSHAYNTLNNIMLNVQNCPSGSNQCSNGIKLNSGINGYAIFVYSFKPTSDLLGSVGTTVRTQAVGNGWNFYTSGGSLISSDDFNVNDYADEVSSTMIFGAYSSDQLQNLLPDNMQDFNRGDEYMYVIGAMPTYSDKYLETSLLQILPAKGISYSWTDSSIVNDNISEGVLNLDGYYNFLSYQAGGSYKQIGTTVSQFAISDIQFGLSVCTTREECDYYSNFNDLYKTTHADNLKPVQGNGNQSIFMSWFNIFSFGLAFPFTSFFQSFTDTTGCVNIPIIAGMLHSNSTQYCSWWSSDIRSVLTPVFSISSIMLIFGFIMHWLRNSDTTAWRTDGKGNK